MLLKDTKNFLCTGYRIINGKLYNFLPIIGYILIKMITFCSKVHGKSIYLFNINAPAKIGKNVTVL